MSTKESLELEKSQVKIHCYPVFDPLLKRHSTVIMCKKFLTGNSLSTSKRESRNDHHRFNGLTC